MLVADGVTTKVGDAEKAPEDNGREQHSEDRGRPNLFNHAIVQAKSADDEATEKILYKEIKKNGNSGESRGEVPLAFLKERSDSLHQEAH